MSGSHRLGMTEFFALEAGEYLERLDALLGAEGPPAADEFVRLARALRGSALMASQPAVGRAAAGLEGLARAVREGRRPWDAGLAQTATRAVDDLKILVRRAALWSDADTRAAEALATHLEQLGGRPSAQVRAVEALGLDAGARAFIAREGAAIASALDRAAQALRVERRTTDPLPAVRRALEPLRGLAALNDLPPLGDLLEGVEQALARARPGVPLADLFGAAAVAVAQAAREVAERGRPDPDAAPFRRFAGLLVRVLDADMDAVPIETLFFTDGGPHLVRRGVAPAGPAPLGRLELVSHGEHLRQAADLLERAPSPTQRELRAHTLAGTLRTLATAGTDALGRAVREFAAVARDAVLRGVPVSAPGEFAAELRRAGDVLSAAAGGDEPALAERLAALTRQLARVGPAPVPARQPPAAQAPPAPRPTPAPAPAPPPPSPPPLAPAVAARVPDTSNAAPADEPGDETGPADFDETADLVGSWMRYERLKEQETGPASLQGFLATVAEPEPDRAAAMAALPLVDLAPGPPPRREPPPAPVPAPVVDIAALAPAARPAPIVDIATLLYRGDRALSRAQELRAEARTASPDRLRALIEEVCDLVALATDTGG
jgi:HPt (histidine-containing phosphotransfer) domain-containing protein